METDHVDLFAGAGGWEIAGRDLDLDPLGIEYDGQACETRHAAGLRTLCADVAALDPRDFAPVRGLIASPPCQAWSRAGKRLGLVDQPAIYDAAAAIASGADGRARDWHDPRSPLVLEPLRWALALTPEWVALEQVPDVLPFWRVIGDYLADAGYDVWTGVLNAADYGVPQTRQRAIMIASRTRRVGPPATTHADPRRGLSMFDQPWVTMAEALGWPDDDRVGFPRRDDVDGGEYRERDRRPASMPAFAVTEKARSWTRLRTGQQTRQAGGRSELYERETDRPAPTLTSGARSQWAWSRPATTVLSTPRIAAPGHRNRSRDGERHFDDCVPVTLDEAAILQSFPPGYPWHGSRTACFLQVANAIPPRLARAVLSVVASR